MISLKSKINSNVTPIMGSLGFELDLNESLPDLWVFSKKIKNETQYVQFIKSKRGSRALQVFFKSTKLPHGINGHFLAGRNSIWWTYDDETSLNATLQQMMDVVIEKGVPWLENSMKAISNPPKELIEELFQNRSLLAKGFSDKYGFATRECNVLEDFIRRNKLEMEMVDWGFIIGVAAFFAEVLLETVGGEWIWANEINEPAIAQYKSGRAGSPVPPLSTIIVFWNEPRSQLTLTFKDMLR